MRAAVFLVVALANLFAASIPAYACPAGYLACGGQYCCPA